MYLNKTEKLPVSGTGTDNLFQLSQLESFLNYTTEKTFYLIKYTQVFLMMTREEWQILNTAGWTWKNAFNISIIEKCLVGSDSWDLWSLCPSRYLNNFVYKYLSSTEFMNRALKIKILAIVSDTKCIGD